jgi:hypothetical protein
MPSSQAIFHLPQPNHVTPPTDDESLKVSSQIPGKADGSSDPSESRNSGRCWIQPKAQPLLPLQPVDLSHVSTLEFPRQRPVITASESVQTIPRSQSIPSMMLNDPAATPDSAAILSASTSIDSHIRKKSGEPLKSSLKSRTPSRRPSLSVITGQPPSKSEPGTPSHARSKSVSFAERLDHVKLFFAEQKPIAVSRDGSPTEDTSGTESEAPATVRKISFDDEKKRLLVMEVANMPQRSTMDVDVMLEDVTLSKEATICGHVKVKNLAFHKCVAIRFTFDSWQTTSEVSAKYERSLAHGLFDRFSFVIRLHDILSKIEDKTLFMAIRYAVGGRELWDNNRGHNYKIKFSLPIARRAPSTIAQIQYASDEEAVADLTQKLERVQSTEALKYVQRFHRRRRSGGTDEDFFFTSTASLSSRYTWGDSLKKPWKPTDYPVLSQPRPKAQSASSSVFPWSHKPGLSSPANQRPRTVRPQAAILSRGSPRLGDDVATLEAPIRSHPSSNLDDATWVGSPGDHTRDSFGIRQPGELAHAGSPGVKVTKAAFNFGPPPDKARVIGGDANPATDRNSSVPTVQAPMFRVAGGIERTPSDDSSITSSTSSSSQPSPVVITAPTEMASIINRWAHVLLFWKSPSPIRERGRSFCERLTDNAFSFCAVS